MYNILIIGACSGYSLWKNIVLDNEVISACDDYTLLRFLYIIGTCSYCINAFLPIYDSNGPFFLPIYSRWLLVCVFIIVFVVALSCYFVRLKMYCEEYTSDSMSSSSVDATGIPSPVSSYSTDRNTVYVGRNGNPYSIDRILEKDDHTTDDAIDQLLNYTSISDLEYDEEAAINQFLVEIGTFTYNQELDRILNGEDMSALQQQQPSLPPSSLPSLAPASPPSLSRSPLPFLAPPQHPSLPGPELRIRKISAQAKAPLENGRGLVLYSIQRIHITFPRMVIN